MPLVDSSEAGDRSSFRLRRIGIPATYPGIGDTFKINKEITVVGRNPSTSDIFLDSKKNKVMISRLHARIITEKDSTGKQTFSISDTSLNGTYVNDIKIADTCNLSPGDTVTFGHLKGAVLTPGDLAQQPQSEFSFKFEKYPATPPKKKQRTSEEMNSSPEFQIKTPSPQNRPKPVSIKTPLLPAAHIPDLSTFHTPGTPGYLTSSCSTNNCRLSSPILGNSKWQQNHASENSDSDESNDDLRVYAAAAGDALEDSDEEIFSIRLPESPESYEKPGTFSHCANKQTVMNSYTAKKIPQPSQQNITEGRKRSYSEEQSPLRVAKKSRPRKHTWTHKKNSQESIISSEGQATKRSLENTDLI
ncbi:uncharacterized protein LOC111325237 isoform X2 [Stylophora pistillata]|uniref:uncharacterized protein LOC111325237 isoform X2 n=1 Tax=Stylophora pistillata TaxID=50429 RepID=UPI000C04BFAB|nr:uncharacterized protein LOC111325237 isoform X2 [Stylophora pistillata]